MKSIFILAKNTFQEMVREKFFLIVIFVSCLLLGVSLLLGSLSFDEQKRILIDLGFAAIELSAFGIAVFSGSFVISREIEKQTCLVLLAKPLSRGQFLIGKWLGISFLVTTTISILSLMLFVLLQQNEFYLTFMAITVSLWMKTLVILAIVFFMSCLVRPVFCLLFGMTIYLLGHWLNDLQFFALKTKDDLVISLFNIVHEITPNFYRFNWKSYHFLEAGIPFKDFATMIFHLSLWIAIFIFLSVQLFRRKDIV